MMKIYSPTILKKGFEHVTDYMGVFRDFFKILIENLKLVYKHLKKK